MRIVEGFLGARGLLDLSAKPTSSGMVIGIIWVCEEALAGDGNVDETSVQKNGV